MKPAAKCVMVAVIVLAALQAVRPRIPSKPAIAELQAPPDVRQILTTSCYSCHSDQRRLSWFDEIVPAYWLVRHDVLTARSHLDFSAIGAQPAAVQKATLFEAVNMIRLGAMPPPQFLMLHPESKVSAQDIEILTSYLAPWSSTPSAGADGDHGHDAASVSSAIVQPEFNGLPLDEDFRNWKPVSTTDRGDNNTFRIIVANDLAFQAVQSGRLSPWPNGARLAKIAWQQERGPDGLIHPGKFVQVELMVKDSALYQTTDGWGWGRWRGLDLKPYGHDAHFVAECTGCHMPVRGNDYVYILPMTEAQVSGNEIVNSRAAALPSNLPYQPLGWGAITMYVDPRSHSTTMLYGNDAAMSAIHAGIPARVPAYPAGAVLALVTWKQRDDPHWFGARLPDLPQSVEFVQVGNENNYQRFAGGSPVEETVSASTSAERAGFILNLAPAQLP
jgi:hypothetical protein